MLIPSRRAKAVVSMVMPRYGCTTRQPVKGFIAEILKRTNRTDSALVASSTISGLRVKSSAWLSSRWYGVDRG